MQTRDLCTHLHLHPFYMHRDSKIYHVRNSQCLPFHFLMPVLLLVVSNVLFCDVWFTYSLCINCIAVPVILMHFSNSWLINPISILRKFNLYLTGYLLKKRVDDPLYYGY
ncbi:hypothetical protein E2542_SST20198 [Spatholobus suberectus]|nr:hypothetical protein E2542_SST20198 [Spatholobus suberectus]